MRLTGYRKTEFYRKHRYRLRRANDLLSLVSATLLLLFLMGDQSDFARKHEALASEIRTTALITGLHTGIYDVDPAVLRAMAQVPRHQFISPFLQAHAYSNVALPLAEQNYILPEPFLSAMMIDFLDLKKTDRVLDIGYGAGYDAAVMSRLAGHVFFHSQRGEVLDNTDFTSLEDRGYKNVASRSGSDIRSWSGKGPFDAILVRQSLPEPPSFLLDLLKPGGRLVVPIGLPQEVQRLMVYSKNSAGVVDAVPTLHLVIAPLFMGHEI